VAAVDRADAQLQGSGRVLLRPSGTEPLVRVMVEATDQATADAVAHEVATAVEQAAGRP
jgi:phosphoglucosamine mutase